MGLEPPNHRVIPGRLFLGVLFRHIQDEWPAKRGEVPVQRFTCVCWHEQHGLVFFRVAKGIFDDKPRFPCTAESMNSLPGA